MKRSVFVMIAVILIGGLVWHSPGYGRPVKGEKILSVNDIQADPKAYQGTIKINGVVAQISTQDPKVFTLIETAEARLCKIPTCARFYLPVKFEGATPKVGDEVNVTGSFAQSELLFVATAVNVMGHVDFGGK